MLWETYNDVKKHVNVSFTTSHETAVSVLLSRYSDRVWKSHCELVICQMLGIKVNDLIFEATNWKPVSNLNISTLSALKNWCITSVMLQLNERRKTVIWNGYVERKNMKAGLKGRKGRTVKRNCDVHGSLP
jgi:hypothetical protein